MRTRRQTRLAEGRRSFHSLPNNIWRTHIHPQLSAHDVLGLSLTSRQRRHNTRNNPQVQDAEAYADVINLLVSLFKQNIAKVQQGIQVPYTRLHLPTRVPMEVSVSTTREQMIFWVYWGDYHFSRKAILNLRWTQPRTPGRKFLLKWPPYRTSANLKDDWTTTSNLNRRNVFFIKHVFKNAVARYNQHPVLK